MYLKSSSVTAAEESFMDDLIMPHPPRPEEPLIGLCWFLVGCVTGYMLAADLYGKERLPLQEKQ